VRVVAVRVVAVISHVVDPDAASQTDYGGSSGKNPEPLRTCLSRRRGIG
jgi:hypothetical protein